MFPWVIHQTVNSLEVQYNTSHLSSTLGNLYSSQTTSGLLKCPTPPPAKSQALNRKHSMELGQVGLLSPASLSPMGSTQSECIQFFKGNLVYIRIASVTVEARHVLERFDFYSF